MEALYATGARASELISIRREDVNWEDRFIRIRKGKGKRERLVFFSSECGERLKAYLATREDEKSSLFLYSNGRPLRYHNIKIYFRKCQDSLGFMVTAHRIRHTLAVELASKGMDINEIRALLGHENLKYAKTYAQAH